MPTKLFHFRSLQILELSLLCPSYFEQLIQLVGVPRLNTPPPFSTGNQEKPITAPKPVRIIPNLVNRLEDLSQPWTRSPTKSKMEPLLPTWHFISPDVPHSEGFVIGMFIFTCWKKIVYLQFY